MTTPKNTARPFGWRASLCVALILIPFVYAAFFTFPEGDDFHGALRARHLFDLIGGVDRMFSAWWKWSGRYFYHFTWVFLGDIAHYRTLYSCYILFIFGLFWLSVFGIAKELGRDKAPGQAAFFATLWLAATLCTHKCLGGWYLLIELETITAGHVFTMLYIWSLCRLWNRPVVSRGAKWFCICSGAAASGCYEYSALLVLLIAAAVYIMARLYEHPHQKTFRTLLIVAGVCFLLSYLARGNFRRQDKRAVSSAVKSAQLHHALHDWWTYVGKSYANPIMALAVLAAGWFSPGWETPLHKKLPFPLILVLGVAAVIGFTGSLTVIHAFSDVPVGAVSKLPAQMVQYSTIIIVFCLLACRERLHLDALRLAPLRLLGKPVCLLAAFALLLGGNSNFFPTLWNGLSGAFSRYEAAYEKRKAVFAAHRKQAVVVMPLSGAPFPVNSEILFADPKDWPNKYYAPFYRVASVAAKSASPQLAYEEAKKRGLLAWRAAKGDAGNSAGEVAFVPSLSLPPNKTYEFDWIFLRGDAAGGPGKIRLFTCNRGTFSRLPGEIKKRLLAERPPFDAGAVQHPALTPLETEDGVVYAVPLPQTDSGKGVQYETWLSVNGGAFFPCSAKE